LGAGYFGVAMGPVSVANGVVFGGSMDQEGNMYALDARTGEVLWSFKSGGSVMSAPAVVDGVLYWGSGYDRGFNNNKFFAFSLPK
jgi:polyvinyl alcohol dehydrogenase (cytochrome)